MTTPNLKAIAPIFGTARMNGERIGEIIGKADWVGIPFAGGCSEVPFIDARSIALNDLNGHIMNLARAIAHEPDWLSKRLEDQLYHPAVLEESQRICKEHAGKPLGYSLKWAAAYFVCVWMSRSSDAGTDSELDGKIATRFTASGGSSVKRWRSAVEGLPAWHEVLKNRCEFTCLDWREFLAKCHDREGHVLYVDPPWFEHADDYAEKLAVDHKWFQQPEEDAHTELADALRAFKQTRVVIRHSDHPLYRELYRDWEWNDIGGRNQANNEHTEFLIVNQ